MRYIYENPPPPFPLLPPRVSSAVAEARGMIAIAGTYHLPQDYWMIHNILQDFRGRDFVLVHRPGAGVELWAVPKV